MEETQIPGLFFFFFFYHAFIVFRYKKLRAALAMEKTKPINQITKGTHSSLSSAATENLLSLKLFGYRTFR